MARVTRDAAGWLLVVALFYSPWDYGGTGAAAIRNLNWVLAAAFLCWLISLVMRPPEVRGPGYKARWLLAVLTLFVLFIGWGMTLNAHSLCDVDYSIFLPLTAPLPQAPGSTDYALSIAWMARATLLLGCVWVTASLIEDARWLLRIWWAAGLAGGSIALVGLLQKATGAEMIFWQSLDPGERPVSTFFATYFYHSNAGAYLNLTLPPILGLAYRYITRPCHPATRALSLTVALIAVVAVMSDTSRVAQAVAAMMLIILVISASHRVFRRVRHVELKMTIIAIVVLAAAMWSVTQASHLDQPLQRWFQFRSSWERDTRWLVDRAALQALPQAGALGFGPGTFSVVFPYFQASLAARANGTWLFLHNDYLQTLMEWGWLGGLLWATIFFGGMPLAIGSVLRRSKTAVWLPRQRMLVFLVLVALSGVALHAAVDFPLQISSIQLYVATYVAICWGSAGWGRGTKMKDEGGTRGRI